LADFQSDGYRIVQKHHVAGFLPRAGIPYCTNVEWKFACRERHNLNQAELIPDILQQLEHLCRLFFEMMS